MKKAENAGNGGCPQRDSTECEEYAGARSAVRPEDGERAVRTSSLLERIKIAGRSINNLRYADDTTQWQKVKRN